jgi:hypothetical protein
MQAASIEGRESAQLIATAFTVTNHTNGTTLVVWSPSRVFGQPIAAREPRRIRTSLQVTF